MKFTISTTFTRILLITLVITSGVFLASNQALGQYIIKGKVFDKDSQMPLAGVNLKVKDQLSGTVTNPNGEFSFNAKSLPITFEVSMIGYALQEIVVETAASNLEIALAEQVLFGEEIVVSASRIQETVLESSVSVEKMDIRDVTSVGAPNFYDAIANIKGIDMNTHSLLFKMPNSRGFNGETNFRFNQMIDGIDNAPPGLSFAAGNIMGISQMDVESVELIMGASSALYGPGGMSGTMLITSKSPFEYPGLSASVQTGMMNINSAESGPTPMIDANLRYAKSFNDKFALKVVVGYLQATDWIGADYSNKNDPDNPNIDHYYNPGYDGVNVYGDDVVVPVNLANFADDIADGVANELGYAPGDPKYDSVFNSVVSRVPDQLVTRTGYKEADVHDHNTYNLRTRLALDYRFNSNLELEVQGGYTRGSSIYTAGTRYVLQDFAALNGKVELKGEEFFLRAWTVQENAGKTFDLGGSVTQFNEAWKSSADWYEDFVSTFTTSYLILGQNLNSAYYLARSSADNRYPDGSVYNNADPVVRPLPGSTEFEELWNPIISKTRDQGGGLIKDFSGMYHFEGMYDFSRFFKTTKLQVGASYRIYSISSDGTIFYDKPGEPIIQNQFGAYAQLLQPFLNERLKLTLSGRYDKNEYFEGQFTPRLSLVFALDRAKQHNLRASTQTAFRFPATQDQWLNMNIGELNIDGSEFNFYVLGGNKVVQDEYDLHTTDVYVLSGNNPFIGVPEGEPYKFSKFKAETVTALELGYKGLYLQKALYVDAYVFHNTYNNFHARQALVQNPGQSNENRYITVISAENPVTTFGWAIGADMMLPRGYIAKANLMNTSIDEGSNSGSGFQSRFNTPNYKINLSFGNYHLLDNLGFNISWRWQDSFNWQSDFGATVIPSYQTLDAQVSLKLPRWSSILKVGGSNLLNQYYTTGFGNSAIGAIYYVSITYDEFLN